MARNTLHMSDRLEEYISIFEGFNSGKLGEKEKSFMFTVRKINEIIMKYSKPDANGDYLPVSPQDLQSLQLSYSLAIIGSASVTSIHKPNSTQKRFMILANQISRLLRQDSDIISALSPTPGMILPAMIQAARSREITMDQKDLHTMGANSSTRIPVEYTDENGIKHRGFFTEGHSLTVSKDAIFHQLLQTAIESESVFASLYKKILDNCEIKFFNNLSLKSTNTPENLESFKKLFNQIGIPAKEQSTYLENDQLRAELASFYTKLQNNENISVKYRPLASEGSGIESRNNAMYSISQLLGVEPIMARSENLIVDIGGHKVAGSFMDTVEGSDMEHPKIDDPMVTWNRNAQKNKEQPNYTATPEAIKQLFQLDVIDYLCGNLDRHSGNFLYHFDTTDPQNPILTGVTGIDNDQSFVLEMSDSGNVTPLNNINYIDETMAQRICELTKDQLTYVLLGHQLSSAEIDAAWNRCLELQGRIRKGMTDYAEGDDLYQIKSDDSIRVLSMQQLSQINFQTLCQKSFGKMCATFKTQCAAMGIEIHYDADQKHNNLHTNVISYNTATLSKGLPKDPLLAVKAQMDAHVAALDSNDPALHINSGSYKKMKKAVTDLCNVLAKGVTKEEELNDLYNALVSNCQNYIESKSKMPSSNYGIARLEIARQMRDLAKERIAALHDPMLQSDIKLQEAKRQLLCKGQVVRVLHQTPKEQRTREYNYEISLSENFFENGLASLLSELSGRSIYEVSQNPSAFDAAHIQSRISSICSAPFFKEFAKQLSLDPNLDSYSPAQIMEMAKKAKEDYLKKRDEQLTSQVPGSTNTSPAQINLQQQTQDQLLAQQPAAHEIQTMAHTVQPQILQN